MVRLQTDKVCGVEISPSEKGLVDLTEPRVKGKIQETMNPKDKNRTDHSSESVTGKGQI